MAVAVLVLVPSTRGSEIGVAYRQSHGLDSWILAIWYVGCKCNYLTHTNVYQSAVDTDFCMTPVATLCGLTSAAAGTGFTGVTAHRSAIYGFFVTTCYSGNSSVCSCHEYFIVRPAAVSTLTDRRRQLSLVMYSSWEN